MISKSLVAVLDKFIILTITAPNDNANQDPVQCAPPSYTSGTRTVCATDEYVPYHTLVAHSTLSSVVRIRITLCHQTID